MSKEFKDLPLDARIAGALQANLEEKYELLKEMGNSMPEAEREYFFEIVNLLQPIYNNENKPK
jgi:hypothetical protein